MAGAAAEAAAGAMVSQHCAQLTDQTLRQAEQLWPAAHGRIVAMLVLADAAPSAALPQGRAEEWLRSGTGSSVAVAVIAAGVAAAVAVAVAAGQGSGDINS